MGLTCMMVNGTAHGDLHAGNIIFIENDETICKQQRIPKFQIGIIDFGLVVTPIHIQGALHFGATNYRGKGNIHCCRTISICYCCPSNFRNAGKIQKKKLLMKLQS